MKLKKATFVSVFAAAALMLGPTAAYATTTVSVGGATSPAGAVAFTGSATGTLNFDTNFGLPGSCTGGTAGGYILRGASGAVGTKVGAIDSLALSSCLLTVLNFPVNIAKKASPAEWSIYSVATPAKGATILKVEIRGVQAQMLSDFAPYTCAANMTGTVRATINTATDQLIIDTLSLGTPALQRPLTIDALDSTGSKTTSTTTTLGGEIQDGDKLSLKGTLQLNQDIAIS